MTVGREWKLILLFTLPIMAGSFLQQLYNTVDGIVVGKFIGEDAFAGVGTCTPLAFIFLAFAMGLGVGVSVTISQYYGARRYDNLNAAIDTSLILMGAIGLFFTVVGFILTPFLLKFVLNTPEIILPYSILYFRIYCIGLFFQFIYNGIAFALRGMGDSKATLYFLLITTAKKRTCSTPYASESPWSPNIFTKPGVNIYMAIQAMRETAIAIISVARKPRLTRSILPAPIFCPVKLASPA